MNYSSLIFVFRMAGILHGGHNHSHDSDLLIHQKSRSVGGDEMKAQQIEHNSSVTTQSQCKSENINVQAASLHILGDFLQSIGVIVAAVVIKLYVS
jgi:Co/Zn/Cd efflux system component